MIHKTSQRNRGEPDAGHTRTLIAGWWVDWSGSEPSESEVLAYAMPNAEQKAAMVRFEAKDMLTSDLPVARAIRALLRMTKPTNQTVVQWRNAFMDLIDSNV